MKISIIRNVPVGPNRGLDIGAVKETVPAPEGKEHLEGVWVQASDGEKVRLLSSRPCEYRILEG